MTVAPLGILKLALRAAARSKLVVVMKSRRVPVSQEPEEAIAAGLTNSDIVCDAALRRAGVLRVERIDEVFAALETLTRMRRLRGERLAIVCNGIGPGMLAVDRLVLAGLSDVAQPAAGAEAAAGPGRRVHDRHRRRHRQGRGVRPGRRAATDQ